MNHPKLVCKANIAHHISGKENLEGLREVLIRASITELLHVMGLDIINAELSTPHIILIEVVVHAQETEK